MMKQFLQGFKSVCAALMIGSALFTAPIANAQQLPDPGFEDWTGEKFDGNIQPKYWHGSNVEQVGFKFNFITRESGRSGYAACVQDKEVGAMGITETGPGYFGLGTPWQYLPGITSINQATAGMSGGISFKYRPDTITAWIKRTGDNWNKEDFHVLFYSWKGTAQGTSYKGKNNNCTSHSETNEESDIRIALDGNECQTTAKGTQIAEGWLRDRKQYGDWTQVRIPIYYLSDEVPEMCNVIFSAGNYPNFRANSGLYAGNAIYVDDVSLIYSSKIDHLYIGGKEWKGFDPNSSEEQIYSVGRTTTVPEVYGMRGNGSLTNTKGTTVSFPGRKLSGSEISISYGQVDGAPTVITVKAEDGSSTTVYKIKMVQEPSDNPRLNSILVNGEAIKGYNAYVNTYNVALPYGTTAAPTVTYVKGEEEQVVSVTQATSPTGKATIKVTAPDQKTTMTYTLNFSVALLSDNTLKDILIDGESLNNFNPTLSSYKVELPLDIDHVPAITPVSAYPDKEQTIVVTKPDFANLNGGQAQISVTTPGNKNARVYKLNFKITASSNSKLKDLQMGGYIVAFNPDNTTYYVDLPMGTAALPEITYVAGDKEQTISVEDGGLNGTTKVTVTAGNGTNQTIYKIICSTQKSDVSYLNDIKLDGVSLEGFSPTTYRYTVNMPIGTTTIPTITTVPGDQYQPEPRIVYGGINATTRIFVTADDGSTSLYEIVFSVKLSDISTLSMITIGGVNLEGFDPAKTEYDVALPQGTKELPAIETVKGDEYQSDAVIRSNGINGDTKITVRSQAGTTTVYILHFSVAQSSKTTLDAVYFDGTKYADYDPAQTDYEIQLPEGVTAVPVMTCDWDEKQQKVVIVQEGTTWSAIVIAESGATATYTFRFLVHKSENAKLKMIYLDGEPLTYVEHGQTKNFADSITEYTITLEKATCPVITVDKDPTQQVTITAPVATGDAKILVQPESGAPMTYTITFKSSLQPYLTDIKADGVTIADFAEEKYEYEVTYSGILPEITFTPKYEGTKASLVSDGAGARIYTEIAGEKLTYVLTFVKQVSNNALLTYITANGVVLENFNSNTLEYSYTLPESQEIPAIAYKCADTTQHVVAGLQSQYKYVLTVIAEDGNAKNEYVINFISSASKNTTPSNVQLDGEDVAFAENDTLTKTIAKGSDLPELTYTATDNQTVISAQTGRLEQQMIVVAENGESEKYVVSYNEDSEISARLKELRLLQDGEWSRLKGFKQDSFTYDVTLPLGTKVAPCVWAIAGQPGQTITITYGDADEQTKIHVVASDGTTTADYVINFAVTKSTNNKLAELTINEQDYSVDENDIVIELPYGSTEPYAISYKKGEDSQLIEFISAPISKQSKIIVTAENGQKNTYTITYKVKVPEGENIIRQIDYQYVAGGETINDNIVPKKGNNVIDLPVGTTSFLITNVVKNYKEQAIVRYDGNIRRAAKFIAIANRDGEEDAVYTVTPNILPDTVGKLKDLKFKGVTVPRFNPDVYNYMINVEDSTDIKDANFTFVAYGGATVTRSSDYNHKLKQVKFKVDGGKEYSVCWFYEKDTDPFDLSAGWTLAETKTGVKPSNGWKVIADYSDGYVLNLGYKIPFVTGKEVAPYGENGVLLSTMRQGALMTTVPGMMTLGEMYDVNFTSLGNSVTKVRCNATVGKQFRNTPEQLKVEYNVIRHESIDKWRIWVTMSDGTNYKMTDVSYNYSDSQTKGTKYINLVHPSGSMQIINATLNSCDKENAKDMSGFGAKSSADLVLQNMHLTYNSALTTAYLDGATTGKTPSNNIFTFDASDNYVGIPALTFKGAVHDQTQTIEWLNNGEWIGGKLTAKVVNYGENANVDGRDSTIYFVELVRDAVTSRRYTTNLDYSDVDYSRDTIFINQPFGTKALPDIQITPESIHQLFAVTKNGREIKVTVTDENGVSQDSVYVFREDVSNNANLASLSASGATLTPEFAEETESYTVKAAAMPELFFGTQKVLVNGEDREIGQTVDLKYTAAGATIQVTAPDGKTQKTYNVHFTKTTTDSDNKLFTIDRDNDRLNGFAEGTPDYSEKYSDNVSFGRKEGQEADKIVETLTDEYMSIAVNGVNTYTITYPTEKSADTELADILYNNQSYDKFSPMVTEYEEETDEPVDLKFILKEDVQSMQIWLGTSNSPSGPNNAPRRAPATRSNATVVNVQITAENGEKKTYTFTIKPESSVINTLASIKVNGEPLADFYPDKTDYTYTIPVEQPKQAEPVIPGVEYVLGQESQTVEVYPATQLGGTTQIVVTPESGDVTQQKTYNIKMAAEASRNAELKNILVNSTAVKGFKPSRTNYSMQVIGDQVKIDYALGDPFQTVVPSETTDGEGNTIKVLTVTAQDGVTTRVYEVEIWKAVKSNNANLADILFNNATMSEYKEGVNFSEKTYSYVIPVMSTDVLPDISAKLQEDAQTIAVSTNETPEGTMKTITVTAEDGVTKNDYTMLFKRTKSSNTQLAAILINGTELENFSADVHDYTYALPVGERKLPSVLARKGETVQTIPNVLPQDGQTVLIPVTAEDGTTATYKVFFAYTLSDNDLLKSISVIGEASDIEGFRPDSFRYSYVLPMGVREAYQLTYDPGQYQKVDTTITHDGLHTIYHFTVEAENGSRQFYSVSYEMQRSNVDTLVSLNLGGKPMVEFEPRKNDYTVVLPAGTKYNPAVEVEESFLGDPYQKVVIDSTKNYTKVSVIAEDQHQRVYTILFEVARSNNANLAGIAIDGTMLPDFDEDKLQYTVALPYDATSLPSVTYSQMEDEQIVKISKDGATVAIEVLAEDRVTKNTYVLNFVRALSSEAHLNMIYLDEKPLEGFMRDTYEYPVVLAYDAEGLPAVSYQLADTAAKVDTIWYGNNLTLRVTSMDETELEYVIDFTYALSPVSWLNNIFVKGEALAEFHKDTILYSVTYPIGTPKSEFLTPDDITYEKADTAETVQVVTQGDNINIIVTAADGVNTTAYVIKQSIRLRDNSLLKAITLDSVMLPHFADSVFYYEYILLEGTSIPQIEAVPQDTAATWDVTIGAIGEETVIYCTAEDGSETQYRIMFRYSTINDGLDATVNDVLVKVISPTQLFVATIRKNVSFALYNQGGNLLYYNDVPVANPNDVDVYLDAQSKDVLNDVTDADSGRIIDIHPGQIYFYSFYLGGKQKIKSGKLIVQP